MKRASFIMALLLSALLSAAPLPADTIEEWEVEVGTTAGHHDNFLYRGEDDDRPAENLYTLYGQAEVDLDGGPGDFLFSLRAAGIGTTEIEGSDYQDYSAGAGYKIKSTRILGEYRRTPGRVFDESGQTSLTGPPEPIFFDWDSRSGEIRQGLKPGLWIGAEYAYETWKFDLAEADRDATVRGVTGTIRIPIGRRLGVKAAGTTERKDAAAPEHDWDGRGYTLALELSTESRFSLLARYGYRTREYENAPSTESNFGREDELQQYLVSLRVVVGDHWGVIAEDSYRDNESTREDRIYTGNHWSAGFFATWGGPADAE